MNKQREPLGLERDVANPLTANSQTLTESRSSACGSHAATQELRGAKAMKIPVLDFREAQSSFLRCCEPALAGSQALVKEAWNGCQKWKAHVNGLNQTLLALTLGHWTPNTSGPGLWAGWHGREFDASCPRIAWLSEQLGREERSASVASSACPCKMTVNPPQVAVPVTQAGPSALTTLPSELPSSPAVVAQ